MWKKIESICFPSLSGCRLWPGTWPQRNLRRTSPLCYSWTSSRPPTSTWSGTNGRGAANKTFKSTLEGWGFFYAPPCKAGRIEGCVLVTPRLFCLRQAAGGERRSCEVHLWHVAGGFLEPCLHGHPGAQRLRQGETGAAFVAAGSDRACNGMHLSGIYLKLLQPEVYFIWNTSWVMFLPIVYQIWAPFEYL